MANGQNDFFGVITSIPPGKGKKPAGFGFIAFEGIRTSGNFFVSDPDYRDYHDDGLDWSLIGRDGLYVRVDNMLDASLLKIGQKVSFSVAPGKGGKLEAVNVEKWDSSEVAEPPVERQTVADQEAWKLAVRDAVPTKGLEVTDTPDPFAASQETTPTGATTVAEAVDAQREKMAEESIERLRMIGLILWQVVLAFARALGTAIGWSLKTGKQLHIAYQERRKTAA